MQMPFTNLTIDINSIPAVESLFLKPVEKDYKKVMVFRWALRWAFLFVLLLVSVSVFELGKKYVLITVISGVFILLALFDLLTRNLSHKKMSYAVREHDVIFRKGWLIQTLGVCPTKTIQHCKISSDLFERMYNLATLSLYTAGSSGADMKIRGLNKEDAEKVRVFVMNKQAGYDE